MKRLFSVLLFAGCILLPQLSGAETLSASHYSKGLIQPANWADDAAFLVMKKMAEPLPAHFDWREKLGTQTKILDQGNCGSCWAHSRVSTLSWQLLIQAQQHVDFAPQELVSCDKEQIGCNGGFWDDYELQGISLEAEFPYKASDLSCKSGLPRKQKIDSWLYIGGKDKTPTKDEMKQAIFQYGPIGVTVAAGGSFPNGCGGGQTNHMVVITGWDDSKGWDMQNSWGTGWGTQGYAYIKYGCFSIGETSAISVLNVAPAVPITFSLENASVKLTATLQPGASYTVDAAKKALQNALNVVGLR